MKKSYLTSILVVCALLFTALSHAQMTLNWDSDCYSGILNINGGTAPYSIEGGTSGQQLTNITSSSVIYEGGTSGTYLLTVTDAANLTASIFVYFPICEIFGTKTPCVNQCETYYTVNNGLGNWEIIDIGSNIVIYQDSSAEVIDFCWEIPGDYMITYLDDNLGETFTSIITVYFKETKIVSLTNSTCQEQLRLLPNQNQSSQATCLSVLAPTQLSV